MNQAELRELLHYDVNNDVFTWIKQHGFQQRGSIAGGKAKKYCINGKRFNHEQLIDIYMDRTINVGVVKTNKSFRGYIIDGDIVDCGIHDNIQSLLNEINRRVGG